MIKWSDTIAQIARQTERNLSSKSILTNVIGLEAYDRPQSAVHPTEYNYASGGVPRPPSGIPKLKIKKKHMEQLTTTASPPRMNNYLKTYGSTRSL